MTLPTEIAWLVIGAIALVFGWQSLNRWLGLLERREGTREEIRVLKDKLEKSERDAVAAKLKAAKTGF